MNITHFVLGIIIGIFAAVFVRDFICRRASPLWMFIVFIVLVVVLIAGCQTMTPPVKPSVPVASTNNLFRKRAVAAMPPAPETPELVIRRPSNIVKITTFWSWDGTNVMCFLPPNQPNQCVTNIIPLDGFICQMSSNLITGYNQTVTTTSNQATFTNMIVGSNYWTRTLAYHGSSVATSAVYNFIAPQFIPPPRTNFITITGTNMSTATDLLGPWQPLPTNQIQVLLTNPAGTRLYQGIGMKLQETH